MGQPVMCIIPHLRKWDTGEWEPLRVHLFALMWYPLPDVRLKNVNFLIPGMAKWKNEQWSDSLGWSFSQIWHGKEAAHIPVKCATHPLG